MHRPSFAVALLLMLAGPAPAALGQPTPAPAPMTNRYEIRYLDPRAAELLAWEQCPEKERCRISSLMETGEKSSRRLLEVRADGATQERVVQALAREDAAPRTRTFQALLLLADDKAEERGDALAPGAREALEELRGVLPFGSFHVLDTLWLRTSRSAQGRLVGRGHEGFLVELDFRNVGRIEDEGLFISDFKLYEEGSRPKPGGEPGLRGPRQLVRTSFSMKEGETIVVGTSRLDGGQEALVLLLTALP